MTQRTDQRDILRELVSEAKSGARSLSPGMERVGAIFDDHSIRGALQERFGEPFYRLDRVRNGLYNIRVRKELSVVMDYLRGHSMSAEGQSQPKGRDERLSYAGHTTLAEAMKESGLQEMTGRLEAVLR